MIIHVVGSPGAGKSTLCKRFAAGHGEWAYFAVDTYRNQMAALFEEIRCSWRPCILESSGGNPTLNKFLSVERALNRRVVTIQLRCNTSELQKRVDARVIPLHGDGKVVQRERQSDITIGTFGSAEDAYRRFESAIRGLR